MSTPTDILMVMEFAGNELFNVIVERGRMPEIEARRYILTLLHVNMIKILPTNNMCT
jgi:carbon catabolite-derepressing protein kinase